MGPALMDPHRSYGGQLDQIHESIVQGRPNGMLSWARKIPDAQIWSIAAYVQSPSAPNPAAGTGAKTMRLLAAPASLLLLAAPAVQARELRVCADPNNMPFSNRAGQGFENKIAEVIAQSVGATLSYTWWAQRRGHVRNTLRADLCDLWPGVASGLEMLATTRPYYRSTYVFVTRSDRDLHISSFDDPRLRQLIVGVQMIGNDAQNTPPTHALARRGIVENVRGYLVYGDYPTANRPPRSSTPLPTTTSTWRSSGVRSPATAHNNMAASTSHRSRPHPTARNGRWHSTSAWALSIGRVIAGGCSRHEVRPDNGRVRKDRRSGEKR